MSVSAEGESGGTRGRTRTRDRRADVTATDSTIVVVDLRISDETPVVEGEATIVLVIENQSDTSGERTIPVKVDGEVIERVQVQLAGGERTTETVAWAPEDVGAHTIEAGDQTLTVDAQAPAEAEVDINVVDLDLQPETVNQGETVALRAVVENDGDVDGSRAIPLRVDGEEIVTIDVTLAAKVQRDIARQFQAGPPGDYLVQFGEQRAPLTVKSQFVEAAKDVAIPTVLGGAAGLAGSVLRRR